MPGMEWAVEQGPSATTEPVEFKPVRNPVIRYLLMAVGWLCVALGTAGIFLPVLPTTPFLLLAAACFVRCSPKFYYWLVGHPRLGKYLLYYLNGKGMPFKAKIYTLLLMWTSLMLTAFVILDSPAPRVVFPLIGLGVSIYILRLPTLKLSADTAGNSDTEL